MKVCFNGEFQAADAPLLPVQNRSFKWGDGLFETMKVHDGRLLLADLHFERLFAGMLLLGIRREPPFSQAELEQNILSLCRENECLACARVRLAVYRHDDNTAGFAIEAVPLSEQINSWTEEGLSICLYPYARKAMDAFANLKSAAYLPYAMAQKFAAEHGYADALVLNGQARVCDSSKANIFLLQGQTLLTPALHQGCVAGVMRRVVIGVAKEMGLRLLQTEVSEEDLLQADEVFLTNAIQVIRWVQAYRDRTYGCTRTREIFTAVSATISGMPC